MTPTQQHRSYSKRNYTLPLAVMGLLAALAWVTFVMLRFDIVLPAGKVAIHFANSICALGGLLLGPIAGGLAGAIGLSLADLVSGYAHAALPTFIAKFCIGVIAGLIGRKICLNQAENTKVIKVVISAGVALLIFNVFFDPFLRYLIYQLLGFEKSLAKMLGLFNMYVAAFNGVSNTVILAIVYPLIRRAMGKTDLWKRLQNLD